MAKRFWIYEEVEKKFHIPTPEKLFKKDSDNIGELTRLLKLKRRDKVFITDDFIQQGNQFEFISVYHNKTRGIFIAERNASLIYTSPDTIRNPMEYICSQLDDWVTEIDRTMWLRIAAPVVDSANILKTEFRQPTQLNGIYLNSKRRKIIKAAQELNITYHVYSKYQDERQLWSDLTAKHAFPVILPQD